MPEAGRAYAHLLVRDRAQTEAFHRIGRGDKKIRDVERRAHGMARRGELTDAWDELDAQRADAELTEDELRALGVIIVLEGADAGFPLRLDSLQSLSGHRKTPKRPKWLLLSVHAPTADLTERAVVWVSDAYRQSFLNLFEGYLEKDTAAGRPRNRELVANISRIRRAVLTDLWQSSGMPPPTGRLWWELWLRPTEDGLSHLSTYAQARGLRMADRVLRFDDRTVVWLEGSWDELLALPFTEVPLAEIRRPEFVDTIEDLPRDEQHELATDLASRVTATQDASAPVVCHLDTGVRRTHVLLADSIDPGDVYSIVDEFGIDEQNHGTPMAGLALYGPLDELLLGASPVTLRHRLESVKILPDRGPGNDPLTYGVATAQAVAMPEVAAPGRPRVFCMPVTTDPENPGEPSLWSASVDALAAGVDITRSDDGIGLIGVPEPDAARLFVISAGNVDPSTMSADYRAVCDLAAIEDPAHAWNALTVGAHTELVDVPTDPDFDGWTALAEDGDVSPHSRTSLTFSSRTWPIKPEICMEGGNVLTDGASDFHNAHPLLSVRTTDARNDEAIGSANATSAATAQAARLAALAQATYPDYWPETIRALLVHAAEWTPVMRAEFEAAANKTARLSVLRRYGWGVPSEASVVASTTQAVTMVSQDTFVPFDGPKYAARVFRLHRLPWPTETLRGLADADVTLRVTLSYFVEPTASRRGWRRRYAYPSHGLRFELQTPTETVEEFVRRVGRSAQLEEEGGAVASSSGTDRWLIGPNQRNLGSLHQDIWEGSAADLAEAGTIGVHPVGGWWKNNARGDRVDRPVRYALIVSLRTRAQGVDLYTPIATQLEVPLEAMVEIG